MTFDHKLISVVVAIDFGTSRSGYAYAFTANKQIISKTDWIGQPVPYVKTLTHLLYDKDRKVEAWGWEAKETLACKQDLFEEGSKGLYFFQNFKIQLRESKDRTQDGPVVTNQGKTFLVLDLITDYLKKLKEDAQTAIKNSTAGKLEEREILWCLTIPAIWTDTEKQLMRRAAQKAGLIGFDSADTQRLLLVLEPEAAAIYCLKNEIDQSQLPPGTSFMVIDCGGGTVDITVHEVLEGGGLSEIAEGTGGMYGSTYVDHSFLDYLKLKLTLEVMELYERDEPIAYLEMMTSWERTKCSFDPQKNHKVIYFSMPVKLFQLLVKHYPSILKKLADEQEGENARIYLTQETMNSIFTPTLNGLVKKVEEQFQKLDSRGRRCDYIFLVGGFSNSPLLQQRIKEKFEMKVKKIIIPQRATGSGAAIVEGAVSYGLNVKDAKSDGLNSPISRRFSRLTYGCLVHQRFQESEDRKDKKYWSQAHNAWYCKDHFDIFIKAGDAVDIDKSVTRTYYPMEQNQTAVDLAFYATENKQVRYTDEQGVKFIGKIVVEMPDTTDGLKREVDISVYFGGPEIQVEAEDKKSGNKYNTTLSFSYTDSPPRDNVELPSSFPLDNVEPPSPPQNNILTKIRDYANHWINKNIHWK